MNLQFICAEIERLRLYVRRQQKEVFTLQRSGIGTASAGFVAGMDASFCGRAVHSARQIGSRAAHRATLHERMRCDSLK